MKIIHDSKQLQYWLHFHQLEQLFPPDQVPKMHLVSMEAGEQIYQTGEALEKVHILVKGKLKIFFLQEDGSIYLIGFNKDFAILGDLELFEDYPLHNEVAAMEASILIEIDKDELLRTCWDYPPFLRFLIKQVSQKFHSSSVKANALSLYPLESRLAAYLLTVYIDDDQSVNFVKTNRYTDLANLLGCSYRHLHRTLQGFVEKGWIEKSGRQIRLLDDDALKELAKDITYI